MKNAKKRRSYIYGLYAEMLAAIFLTLKGYRILKWRYKTPVGELDLLVKKRNVLVIVEVKARKDINIAKESLAPKMQKRIIRAAEYYMSKHSETAGLDMRFDLMAIGGFFSLQHLDNAWQPTA